MQRSALIALAAASLLARPTGAQPSAGRHRSALDPLLIVLADTGAERDGLPVLARAPDERRYLDVLERGFSRRILRLYRWVQTLRSRRDGTPVEPAYLALTSRQGGFPRYGFHLDGDAKPDVAYIDLHRNSDPSGRFGAMDQIFPHELLHVIVRQLAGDPPEGGANQVHAIGVRTDPQVAFNEGFAESVQILAVDDPDAVPETRALARDGERARRAEARLAAYSRALTARWSPATRARLTFPVWFSQTEQALRYHAVKANRFAFDPAIPERLLRGPDVYDAYLIASVLPGSPRNPRKSPGRLFSTEGVVSALFSRWVASAALQAAYRDEAFYESFGAARAEVSPLENAYLKLFHALDRGKPHDASALVRAYLDAFPGEVPAVEAVAREIGIDPRWQPPAEIWLANGAFRTGTTLFDQARALPRKHTFDLNAASLVDLMGVEGMTREAAEAILRAAPYASVAGVARVPGVTADLAARFEAMERDMQRLRVEALEDTASLSLQSILMPYVYRAALWWLVTALACAALHWRVRPVRWSRAALNGIAAALLGLAAAWTSDAFGGAVAWLLPAVIFGAPAALWQIARRRPAAQAARILAAWTLASLAPFAITRAWF